MGSALARESEKAAVLGQESLSQCPINNPESIVDVARKYPNPEIRVMTPQEFSDYEAVVAEHNSVMDGRLMIEVAPPFGCGDKVRSIYIFYRARRNHDMADILAQAKSNNDNNPVPKSSGIVLDGSATQERTIPNTALEGTEVYDAPGYPAQGGTNQAPVYGGQARQDVPRTLPRPTPQAAATTRLCGTASIAFPANPRFKMGYSLCLISESVPISTRVPTPAVEAQLRNADLDKFNKGWPTIVRFQGYRDAWNQYTTTEIWVRPNGRLTNQVFRYRVNSPMTLRQQ
jgi:hypothetical protein